ncbi:NADH-quinone oxidoreductase subunit L [Hyphomicrobium sulfonivorans]|uniref:NADH-quinone oxidoreductase subunit L n=1 Tax=Hyphomicrobium sulfonivorans TaxID=121290 RepID=UPI00156E1F84|nr:NADH-quinone oxidoreductase subunit L [Hyphomicrobium sulfonivorans]MBI1650757.1 NADH-quinone oxidoreductase subunit L [Hyphomicrobium sulfonivorans]NSL71885.1 NADH-quinone oxidoreductase subunit L [Hyphomicrobium sulfonivorans]
MIYSAIVFLPALGALIAGLFGRFLGPRPSELITTGMLITSCALSWIVFWRVGFGHETAHVAIERWITSGELDISWAFKIDTLTAMMFVVVTTVSALVHLYSIGYMHEDDSRPRFFAYLSGFTFAMLMLVTADNLVQMFFGWEGVGLFSYLLIGFWYQKPEANAAAIKAFVVNRVGDFGFLLGIFGLFLVFRTVNFDQLFAAVPDKAGQTFEFLGYQVDILTTVCLLLFMGAMGKSAQFLLHTWLPDAMEGPTPVSALIHAATMVTAGVFMVARLSPIFEYAPIALNFVVLVGAVTAFFAATVGLVQNDIKRVIAYSTCSQLGYMFVACGIGAYQAGVFHLFTHAFFKALLFLGAGSVIHAMHHEQDMRNMGGLRSKIPFTFAMMLIGTLALTGLGIPGLGGLSGFYSKDAIVEGAFAAHKPGNYAFWLLVIAAFMTSFYSWRLMFMTFYGKTRADHHTYDHAHESPPVMLVPLAVLAFGAVAAGAATPFFIGDAQHEFWGKAIFNGEHNHILHELHHVPTWVKWSPTIAMLGGFTIAWIYYIGKPSLPAATARAFGPLYRFLLNKWYFDELYNAIFVKPTFWLANFLWKVGDIKIINGLIDGTAAGVYAITQRAVRLQTGYIYHYAFAMLIGVALLITYVMFMGGAR